MTNSISLDSIYTKNNPYLKTAMDSQSVQMTDSALMQKVDSIRKSAPKLYRVFPKDVEYSSDIFEKQHNNPDKEWIFTASDGKKYDIFNSLMVRMKSAVGLSEEKKEDLSLFERIGKFFKTGLSLRRIRKAADKYDKILHSSSINESFLKLTGYEYTNENTEKFLKGEIKLKIENSVEKYIDRKIKPHSSEPYISEHYVNKKTLTDMNNTRTELNETETEKYEEVKKSLSSEYQTKLENALKNGQLLQNNFDDKTTVLESLHKILTTPRANNLNNKQILEECVEILDNPYIITQQAEDIPEEYQGRCKEREGSLCTCTAASVEFYLAQQHSAQFFEMVEALTSENKCFNKNVNLEKFNITMGLPMGKNLSDTFRLDEFKSKYTMTDENTANIKMFPDENAYLLAEIQTKYKDKYERSIVDIIMQSTIMNLGSQGTYESVSDKREPNQFNQQDKGLQEYEVNFVINVLTDDNIGCCAYTVTDWQGNMSSPYKKEDIKNEILDALNKKGSVVAGYYWGDTTTGIEGHEITITGFTKDTKGQGMFIIQDSDDLESRPVTMPEDMLLKSIHHAFVEYKTATVKN